MRKTYLGSRFECNHLIMNVVHFYTDIVVPLDICFENLSYDVII